MCGLTQGMLKKHGSAYTEVEALILSLYGELTSCGI